MSPLVKLLPLRKLSICQLFSSTMLTTYGSIFTKITTNLRRFSLQLVADPTILHHQTLISLSEATWSKLYRFNDRQLQYLFNQFSKLKLDKEAGSMVPQTAVMKIQNNSRVRSRAAVPSKLNPGMGWGRSWKCHWFKTCVVLALTN